MYVNNKSYFYIISRGNTGVPSYSDLLQCIKGKGVCETNEQKEEESGINEICPTETPNELEEVPLLELLIRSEEKNKELLEKNKELIKINQQLDIQVKELQRNINKQNTIEKKHTKGKRHTKGNLCFRCFG